MPSGRGCEIGGQVLIPKTVVWMKMTESGRGLGAEASVGMLLGGVKVGVVLSALMTPEPHSMNKSPCRMRKEHPFLYLLC